MKWIIASDIHGSAYYCKKLIDAYVAEKAKKMLILGDILYHGPRNDLPRDYAPKQVISMLNEYKRDILCVRGNCDTEVDQMVLDFPMLADYAVVAFENSLIYATHGHVYNQSNLPPIKKGDVLLHGHTHVAKCEEFDDYVYINPGSVSIPKEDTNNGYILYEDGVFYWKDFNKQVYMQYSLK